MFENLIQFDDVLVIKLIKIKINDLIQMLESYGVTPANATNGHHKIALKRNVVETARTWPLYFARLYPVTVSSFA